MSMGVSLLLSLMGCGDSKDEPVEEDDANTEAFAEQQSTLRELADAYSSPSSLPIDPESTYVTGEGVTRSSPDSFSYTVDPTAIYRGESFDAPMHLQSAERDVSYTGEPSASRDVQVSVDSFYLMGNLEEEKDDSLAPLFPFADEYPFGSLYVSAAALQDGDATEACVTSSPARFVSSFAQSFHPFFADVAALSSQTPVPQRENSAWPLQALHNSTKIEDQYIRNIAGAFESGPLNDNPDNPSKLEFGALPQQVTYTPALTVGVLPESFALNDVCVRISESDALLGGTGAVQVKMNSPAATLDDLVAKGLTPAYKTFIGHNLLDSTSVFYAQCFDGQPLSHVISPAPWSDAKALDVSSILCGDPESAWPSMAGVWLNVERTNP